LSIYSTFAIAWMTVFISTGDLPAIELALSNAATCSADPTAQTDQPASKAARKIDRPGVTTPGVRIPVAKLQPDAVFPYAGFPDWLAVGEHVWVSNAPKGTVAQLDVTTDKVKDVIAVGKNPASGLAIGFGSLWVPCCGDDAVRRIDLNSGKITAAIKTTIANTEGGIAVGAGSVWICTDKKGVLARIDPEVNKIVGEINISPGSFAVIFAADRVWVTSTGRNLLTCVDPHTNAVVATITTGPAPRFLAAGEGSIWTLNQMDGTVSRIDETSHKVVATIEVGVPGGGGDIAVGEGSVWVTTFDFPLTRIDPNTNRVVQQFAGPGGDAVRVGLGSVWLSNGRQGNIWRLDPKKIMALR
jgi:YVTN family beta-propeller protein